MSEITGIVTPDTVLRCYRRLVARKCDGSTKRCVAVLLLPWTLLDWSSAWRPKTLAGLQPNP